MADIEKVDLASENLVDDRLSKLKEMMPEVFSESGIDFDKLRLELGDEVDEGQERYAFTWPGKTDAIRQSQTVSTATLRPCMEKSRGRDGEDGSFDSDNIYIEGDNLEVLKLLQRGYHGKVKMIYIDPPYNTGHDFVYKDSFGDTVENYKEQTGHADEANPDTSGRYHANWCSMFYPRLRLAHELLCDDGLLFASIDENELLNLRKIGDEVFGENHLVACFPRITKKAGKSSEAVAKNHDYVVCYSKGDRPDIIRPTHTDVGFRFIDEWTDERGPYKLNQTLDYDSLQYGATLDYPIELDGNTYYPGGSYELYLERQAGNHARADWAWRWSKKKFEFGLANGFVVLKTGGERPRIYTKTYQNASIVDNGDGYAVAYQDRTRPISTLEFIENGFSNDSAKKDLQSIFENAVFDYPKPVSLVEQLIDYSTRPGDIILDFFSGSATTAHALLASNYANDIERSYILVQLPELLKRGSEGQKAGFHNLCEMAEERIRRAGKKIAAEVEEANRQLKLGEEPRNLPDIGFRVFTLDESGIERSKPGQLVLDVVKPDRTELDIVFEMMLKWGLELTLPVEKSEAVGYPVWSVACDELVCCMSRGLTIEALEAIADMEPRRVLILDSVLDDTLKLNAVQIFKHAGERMGCEIELRTV